jgi:thiosulfate dehydrogenase (quinone) large subunit
MSTIFARDIGHPVSARDTSAVDATITNHEAAYALLRVAFGVVFLTAGIGKFMMGIGTFATGLEQQFAGKLPAVLVMGFGYTLPFAEVAIGALLVFGLFNFAALVLAGLLLITLTFGTIVEGEVATAAHNVQYALVNSLLLWFAAHNGFSLDRLFRR